MRIVTHNINGIRAADKRGFRDWLAASGADVVALQEVRARPADVPAGVFGDYFATYSPGRMAGRNGVALLTRRPPVQAFAWAPGDELVHWAPGSGDSLFDDTGETATQPPVTGIDNEFAHEGRLVGVELADAPLTVVSVYVPKGGVPQEVAPKAAGGRDGYTPEQNEARYRRKMAFLTQLSTELDALRAARRPDSGTAVAGRHLLVLGDFNIAHGPADVSNWRTNLASEGFLPAERAWMDAAIGPDPSATRLDGKKIAAPTLTWRAHEHPLVDVMRALHAHDDGPYSWWSWRGQAFTKDVGWRIDYHLASPELAGLAEAAWIDRAPDYDSRVSDHAPVFADYRLSQA